MELTEERVREIVAEMLADAKKKPSTKDITAEFIGQMISKWGYALGGHNGVQLEIDTAMNHIASDKAKNKRLYIEVWLRRSAAFKEGNGTAGRARMGSGDGVLPQEADTRKAGSSRGGLPPGTISRYTGERIS